MSKSTKAAVREALLHRDTPQGPVLRLPWALLLAPVLLLGFLVVVCFILAVRALLALEEIVATARRWGRRAVLVLALALVEPSARRGQR